MGDDQLAAARATVENVLAQARDDEAYRASLLADPAGVLAAAGLATDEATFVADYEFTSDEVQGHRVRQCTPGETFRRACDTISCIISMCGDVPYTNYVP